ncbi:MAG TPA: alanine racemase [Bryobacteraceae bacterium]|nr:alanine racemase [Bryobacteraceae bacterium]
MSPRFLGDIDTPAIVVDVRVLEQNLRRTAEYARANGVRLRPHTKTHKIPELAKRQLELGAVGLTVAKTTEAEVMLSADPPDLLLAYPVVGLAKLQRAVELARRTQVTVALDSAEAAAALSDAASAAGVTIHVLAEMDVGLRRVGVQPGQELLELLQEIDRLPGLTVGGVAFYPGHIKEMGPAGDDALTRHNTLLEETVAICRAAGIELPIVSGGSTPALFRSHLVPAMNEIRPGTYVFNDRNTWLLGGCTEADCAATVLATVVSTAVPGRVIVDGGSKTFSSDRSSADGAEGFGHIPEAPDVLFEKMNEEHGFFKVAGDSPWKVGDRVRVLPNHICTAVNLHEKIYGVEDDRVVEVWEVRGRGKLQ